MATGSSIEGMGYGPNRSLNAKQQPMSNNYINRSLQGGLPTQADSMSMGGGPQAAYNATIGTVTHGMQGAETIQPSMANGVNDKTDPNGVSLTNLLTNIKV